MSLPILLQKDIGTLPRPLKVMQVIKLYPLPSNSICLWSIWLGLLKKAMWEREKILLISIFSFPLNVFYPVEGIQFFLPASNLLSTDAIKFGKG